MYNSFFTGIEDESSIGKRILEVLRGRVGLYSIGLYPASLAYNSAMQTDGKRLLLAPRTGRDLLGAFSKQVIQGMDSKHVESILCMGRHLEGSKLVNNNLSDLILRCELVILSANSNHINDDINQACIIREQLDRQGVLIAILSGSFTEDPITQESYVICEKYPNIGFFSGFHRHDALRNPLDSFTANFCHPNALIAMLGSQLLDNLSPNIQVSPGVHNIEAQYIKAAKNMSSIFAGFGYSYHIANQGLLPTLLTILHDQCLDQAASVSMCRPDRVEFYNKQPFSLTELGYGVQKIEAELLKQGDMHQLRDHTFSQLTAMVADVRGSMMDPKGAKPTRNFQAGQVLGSYLKRLKRCPTNVEEFLEWCEINNLKKGALEGIKSLKIWPKIIKKYSIPLNDASMINLLYMSIYGPIELKTTIFRVLTDSRSLTNYCQESVRPSHSRKYAEAVSDIYNPKAIKALVKLAIENNEDNHYSPKTQSNDQTPDYQIVMNYIENNILK